jgi:hypothetical protein
MKFWLRFLAYLVPTFPLGYVWHLVAFHEAYARLAIYRDDPIIPLGLASMVVQGLVFSWAYPRIGSAVRFGAVAAALSWSFTTLAVGAKHPMASVPDFLALETAFTVVQFAAVAPLMALAHRRGA